MRTDGQTDRHDEAISHISQFFERALKTNPITQYDSLMI